jgi:hypothetical protein
MEYAPAVFRNAIISSAVRTDAEESADTARSDIHASMENAWAAFRNARTRNAVLTDAAVFADTVMTDLPALMVSVHPACQTARIRYAAMTDAEDHAENASLISSAMSAASASHTARLCARTRNAVTMVAVLSADTAIPNITAMV